MKENSIMNSLDLLYENHQEDLKAQVEGITKFLEDTDFDRKTKEEYIEIHARRYFYYYATYEWVDEYKRSTKNAEKYKKLYESEPNKAQAQKYLKVYHEEIGKTHTAEKHYHEMNRLYEEYDKKGKQTVQHARDRIAQLKKRKK